MAAHNAARQKRTNQSGRLLNMLTGSFGAALSCVWALSGSIRVPPELAEQKRTQVLTVVDRRIVAHDADVVALTLAAIDGQPLPYWFPGAHIEVHLPSGRVRQYSLCGAPDNRDSYRIAVRRITAGGGGSMEMHDDMRVGAMVTTEGPRNGFPLSLPGHGSTMQHLRFIAGGIGVTPILPMLAKAEAVGVNWSMLYAGRSADSMPFLDELVRYGDRVVVRTDNVHGTPTAADLLGDCPDGTAVYACGPAPMLTAIRTALAGRRQVELHFERFAAPPVIDGEECRVSIASTGMIVDVGADETVLAALQRAAVPVRYSCHQGFCGLCRTRVLDGTVDHRDTLLTEDERGEAMLLCRSRGRKGAVLGLDL
ncbi:oxidoreductase [Mycobacterium kubicae]|nr:oxidoreductase [Mycobacterium kubicae]